MARTNFLDQGCDSEIASTIIEALEDAGYNIEEMIPGLILAVTLLAEKSNFREELLDEAANLLADGPVGDELWEDN